MSASAARRLLVTGRVQRVGYRQAMLHEARALGLVGWVRNRADGAVEALVQGAPDEIARIIDWCRQGPAGARVDLVSVELAEPQAIAGFEVHATLP